MKEKNKLGIALIATAAVILIWFAAGIVMRHTRERELEKYLEKTCGQIEHFTTPEGEDGVRIVIPITPELSTIQLPNYEKFGWSGIRFWIGDGNFYIERYEKKPTVNPSENPRIGGVNSTEIEWRTVPEPVSPSEYIPPELPDESTELLEQLLKKAEDATGTTLR